MQSRLADKTTGLNVDGSFLLAADCRCRMKEIKFQCKKKWVFRRTDLSFYTKHLFYPRYFVVHLYG